MIQLKSLCYPNFPETLYLDEFIGSKNGIFRFLNKQHSY